MSRPKSQRSTASANAVAARATLWRTGGECLVAGAAVCLLTTIWLVPCEGAAEGETTWRAIAWILLALIWSVCGDFAGRQPAEGSDARPRRLPRFTLLDIAVLLIIVGHLTGGAWVLATTGQRRLAANLLVEWIGLGAAWWILRSLLCRREWRWRLTRPLLAAAISVAFLGIWQHHVGLPEMAAELAPKLAELRDALAAGRSTPLAAELAAVGVPTTEPGLTLFENRLLHSREPFGLFGLANTLGGLLASAVVWLVAVHRTAWMPAAPIRGKLVLGAASLVLLYCLLLTKSRTAVVGLAAGLLVAGCAAWNRSRSSDLPRQDRYRWGVLLGICLAAGLIPLGLIVSGGWDLLVLVEAPKSLQYRWLYWAGATRLIQESPWLGVGLGQFRSNYLRVKSPLASEEIADPHNLWLDAWVNGGLIAVAGLVLVAVGILRFLVATWRPVQPEPSSAAVTEGENFPPDSNAPREWSVVLGGLAAYLVVFAASLASGHWDDRLLVMTVVWGIATYVLTWAGSTAEDLSWASVSALVAVLVHLHGAGGLQMPGVVQWCGILLGLSAVVALPRVAAETHARADRHRGTRTAGMAAAAAVAISLWLPDVRANVHMDRVGEQLARGQARGAVSSLRQAAEADGWNPVPWMQLAELRLREFRDNSGPLEMATEALDAINAAQQRDPANPHLIVRQAEIFEAMYRRTTEKTHLESALLCWRRAHSLYPTSVSIAAEWAEAALRSGDLGAARHAAQVALDLDDLNRSLMHMERWLSEQQREQMKALMETPSARPDGHLPGEQAQP